MNYKWTYPTMLEKMHDTDPNQTNIPKHSKPRDDQDLIVKKWQRKFNSFDGTETDTEDLKEALEEVISTVGVKILMSKEEFKKELDKAYWQGFADSGLKGNEEFFETWYKENYK